MNTSISDLKSKGFVVLAYPPALRQAVSSAVESWREFCALPTEVKQSLPYSNDSDGVGYELKDGVGNKADRKENADIATGDADWLKAHPETIGNPVARNFIEQATGLVALMKPTILEFAHQAEKEFGLEGFADEVDQSEQVFFVRFIHYFGDRKVGEEIATAHPDQSGFTLHLFESDPGLQCLTLADRQWIDMPVSEGETVIIPSLQMQLRSKGELTALYHRVVATPETAAGGRYSAVCFVQLACTPKYNKAKHGRLQEKPEGFNYGLSDEGFAELFA